MQVLATNIANWHFGNINPTFKKTHAKDKQHTLDIISSKCILNFDHH
jgi:hypothetical protein